MKIYETAVRKPISTILIFLGVIVFGLYSLKSLPVDMYPEMDVPSISVITTYTGANASDIETNITKILENSLNTVSNLKKLTSRSSDNISIVSLEMEWGTDLNEASNDIRDVVSRVQSQLPDGAETPIIFRFSTSMIPVVVLSITADESYAALYKILDEKMVNVLNRVDGVGAVSIIGNPTREIQVNIDPYKLESYNLTVEQIGGIISAENSNIPAGMIDVGNNTYSIKSDGQFDSSDDLNKIIVANRGGRDIFLKDVASINDTLKKATMDERAKGKLGVRVIVQKQSGANTVNIAKEVLSQLENIEKTLPKDAKVSVIMDGSESIVDSIKSLSDTVMYAFIFVILVVLFFLGRWRATFIICLTIPVSLIVSFIYLKLTGGTINVISLSSLSIAIGMVVDDAIVVLENITKHIERGSTPKEASIYATNEVWLAVIATTLTVVAVFLPLTMMTGMAGIMFKPLGWIVSLVVVVSTIAAITLTPMLSALMLKAETKHTYKGVGVVFKPIDKFLDRLDNWYGNILTWAVRHRAFILSATIGIFLASIPLILVVPKDFIPASDNGFISATVKLEQNIGVEYTATVAREIDSIIATKYPEIYIFSTSAGANSSNNAFAAMNESASYMINYMMRANKLSQRNRSIFEISDLLRADLAEIPEVREFTVTPGGNMGSMGGGSSIELKIFGYDFNQTNNIAIELRDSIKLIPGAEDVVLSRDDMRPEYNVKFDRNALSMHGLNSAQVASSIRNRINGLVATKYTEDGEEYDIVVRNDDSFRHSFEDIENIVVYNAQGNGVRVKDLGKVVEEFAPPAITRENRQRVVSVNAALTDGYALSTVTDRITEIINRYPTPDGVSLVLGGTLEDQSDSFSDLLTLGLLIIMLVYIVMATQFESFKMPFIIMFTLLPAFTGVLLALWMTNTTLSLLSLIGAIMLIGIVVKNGIVMVDYTNLLRERGSSVNHSVINAGKSRLRPVLMTSLTTILGMVPLAMGIGEGSEMWQPMGIAVIGGLTFSTILTLVVVPVVYSIFGATGIKKERKKLKEENS